MKRKDIKIGMKVVPHSKSCYWTYDKSKLIKRMKIIDQPYLYVVKEYPEGLSEISGSYYLNMTEKFNPDDVELFKYFDFDPYEEEYQSIAEQHFISLIGRKYKIRFNSQGSYNEVDKILTYVKGNIESISNGRVVLYDEEYGFNIIPFHSIIQMLEVRKET